MTVLQKCGMFLVGLSDAASLHWLKSILFVTHPETKEIHPSSFKLIDTFKNTFIQVIVFMIALPNLFLYLDYVFIYYLLNALFLLLTYGYLFFYNTDIMTATKEVALWAKDFPKCHFPEFDSRERAEFFYSISNQLKSFIFLVLYYTPIFVFLLLLTNYFPFVGLVGLVLSESFFNSAFYFLKKWPYDRYNIGFIEKNLPYMLGYGFFVSVVCNVILSGSMARGVYFIMSEWMIINCIIYSPPEIQFKSWGEVLNIARSRTVRGTLKNGYTAHRQKIRTDRDYRKNLLENIIIVKPALKITEAINQSLATRIGT